MATNLREIRRQRGLTQNQLSIMTNIPRVCISRYETGKYQPNLEKASRLANALDVPVDALVKRR